MPSFGEIEREIAKAEGEFEAYSAQLEDARNRLTGWATRREETEGAQKILQRLADVQRAQLATRIERLVTLGIRSIFRRDDLTFRFLVKVHKGRMTVDAVLVEDEGEGAIPKAAGIVDGHGGGVADIISFVLRVVSLVLLRPRFARVLVLDEPFRHVSREYLPAVAGFVREIQRKLSIQIIIVTHKPELEAAADVVYHVSKRGGESVFERELADADGYEGGVHLAPSPTIPDVLGAKRSPLLKARTKAKNTARARRGKRRRYQK